MLRREHTPHNVKKNEEEAKYKSTLESIDLNSVSDSPTKTALDQMLTLIKSVKETSKPQ